MNLKLKRTPGIYLVGFMASGKSTIGRHLAHRLGWSFFDTDTEIESAENSTIAEIFDTRGESEFRNVETGIIRQHLGWIERGRPAVLALGGGAFVEPVNRALLQDNGLVVWLNCPLHVIKRRLGDPSTRPLARDAATFEVLFEKRREIYQLADIHIAIESDDPAVAVESIVRHPLFQ
ncbi:MAG TPA: shikimate kinase [Bryobacteraceae bacterium]|nr:shikimate kinase [Bryobacteraceae bacterium]